MSTFLREKQAPDFEQRKDKRVRRLMRSWKKCLHFKQTAASQYMMSEASPHIRQSLAQF
jgi:hypothetical protein